MNIFRKIMSEHKKDNLENFFRERAQNHNLDFKEDDWLKLEAQLDEEMPVANIFGSTLKKYWILPLVLIILPVSWYAYNSYYGNNRNNLHTSEEVALVEETVESLSNKESFLNKESIDASAQNIQSINEADITISESKNEKQKNVNITSIKARNKKNEQIVLINDANTAYEYETKNTGYVVFKNGALSEKGIFDFGLHFLSPIVPDSEIAGSDERGELEIKSIDVIAPGKNKESYFSIAIGYSPDFSTVGLSNYISPGARWNILAEYGISRRFSINTGIVWVNNKYETYGEDYHAPVRYWQNGIVASQAYGECQMVDIPLNIRYDYYIKDKHKLFISGGVSTYFLLKEDYYFTYYPEDPYLPQHWGTDKMTIYPFGIINFSIGYQYDFSKKSSIQIEPFIKIPTTGVGWGKVDLHTIGVYFMYKYRLRKN